MHRLNGYSIIATRSTKDHRTVILGAATLGRNERVFVTAVVENMETSKEWFWGHYFNSLDFPGAGEALQVALTDFQTR